MGERRVVFYYQPPPMTNKQGIKVLSLFDWMSCGMIALERAWIEVDKYYASEIDQYAIKISQKNYPDVIQIWDVERINFWSSWSFWWYDGRFCRKWEHEILFFHRDIDLIIWWSPCQGFSFAGKQLAFDDPRSKLFFEYVNIVERIRPKYFVLENVKMKKEFQDIISDKLFGIKPIEINSSLVSAQNRKRLYWIAKKNNNGWYTQVNVPQPKDKWIILRDIIESDVDEKYYVKAPVKWIENMKWSKIWIIGNWWQGERIYSTWYKSVSLSALWWWRGAKTGLYAVAQRGRYIEDWVRKDGKWKTQQRMEMWWEKSNTITSVQKDSMLAIVNRPRWFNKWSINKKKSPSMWSSARQQNNMVYNGIEVRSLTPIECERLQTVPDNYTEWVSNTQRYKMLWNGWTVDVIAHIFSYINKLDDK